MSRNRTLPALRLSAMPGRSALIVIDVQVGFDDPRWGPRNNPDCESNIVRLINAWRSSGEPVVLVRHDSVTPSSPLRPGERGNSFKPGIDGAHNLLVTKSVHSAFYGTPDLNEWLKAAKINEVAICGITTNYCCETTARMAGDLGYAVDFILDATHTFDLMGPDGAVLSADDIARVTATNLHGEFATVVSTAEVLAKRPVDQVDAPPDES